MFPLDIDVIQPQFHDKIYLKVKVRMSVEDF